MKKLIIALTLFAATTSLFATQIIVPGRATSITKDGDVVTINCDGFWQSDICYSMTFSGVNELLLEDALGNPIASGNVLFTDEYPIGGTVTSYVFIFED